MTFSFPVFFKKAIRSLLSLPKFILISLATGILAALLLIGYTVSSPFADFANRTFCAAFRLVCAYTTAWIPFSLAEACLILALPWAVFLTVRGIRRVRAKKTTVVCFLLAIVSVVSLLLSTFSLLYAPGYHTPTLDEKLGLTREKVSAEDLYETAVSLAEDVKEDAKKVSFLEGSFSVMPYGIGQMSRLLNDAYAKSYDSYPFLTELYAPVKPVLLSEAMSYTQITGMYSVPTGEANIDVNFPDYTLPYTAAHEMAHQRGIAREEEANFVAFLILRRSDDDYLRYCGDLGLLEYVMSSLASADRTRYVKLWNSLPENVKDELRAYSAFFDKYRDSTAAKVSDKVNNAYLTAQGTAGTRSYGMVTDLAVAWVKDGKTV